MHNRDHNNHDRSKGRHYNDDLNHVTDKVEFADENEFLDLDQLDSNDHNKQRKNKRQNKE